MKVTGDTITDLQCWAVRGFAAELGDITLTRITDRSKLAVAFSMYMTCYPKFSAAWNARHGDAQ